MIGIDTNVLIRYLVRDDLAQAQEASRIIEKQSVPIFVNTIVLCELVWVLESAYECTKKSIASVLKKILSTKQFEIPNRSLTWRALDLYENCKADFSDILLGMENQAQRCTITVTFDKNLNKLSFFELLKADDE
jgi:predicted nucleic-acid-binding protein